MKAEHITPEQLREFLNARAKEHRRQGFTDSRLKRGVEIVPVNLYRGDPAQTAQVLLRELDIKDIIEVVHLLEAKLAAQPAA